MKVTIFETSDIHGHLYPSEYQERNQNLDFGLLKVVSKLKKEKEICEGPIIHIDNGDFIQGSPLSYYVVKEKKKADLLIDALNDLEIDAGVIGNHEFNYGLPYLTSAIRAAKFPVLAANILDETGEPAFGPGYTILEKEGIKIAILGLTTPYIPNWEHPDHLKGLTFQSALLCAKEYVPLLRKKADVVIVSYHGGFERDLKTGEPTEVLTGENEGYAILHEVEGMDVFLTGHQHREIAEVINGIPVIQPGHKGRYIGKVTLTVDKTEAGVVVSHPTAELLSVADEGPDAKTLARFAPLNEEVEQWLDQEVGKIEGNMEITDVFQARIQEHPYVSFIHDVQRHFTGADISGTALFTDTVRGFQETVTMRDIVTNYIYPNTLAVSKLSGEDLKAALERSAEYFQVEDSGEIGINPSFMHPKPQQYNYDMYAGIQYVVDVAKPIGERIVSLTYKGEDIRPEDTFEVVLNQYRAVGGGEYEMFDASKIVREVTIPMTELIGDYFRAYPLVKAKTTDAFNVIASTQK